MFCLQCILNVYLRNTFDLGLHLKIQLGHTKFNYYIDLVYPKELDIKYTADAPKLANYLDI